MKNAFKLSIVLGVLFSWLFYKQRYGLNTIVFSVILIVGMVYRYPISFKRPSGWFSAACLLFSAFSIYLVHSDVAHIVWLFSFANLISIKEESGVSILNHVVTYGLNFFTSPITIFLQEPVSENEAEITSRLRTMLGYVFVALVVIVFFIIYQDANPLFLEYTKEINFDNISMGFILFCLFGFYLMSVFFFPTKLNLFSLFEEKQQFNIHISNEAVSSTKIKMFSVLFILLNAMLILINVLDINYLYFERQLPKGITNSEFVHNGVGTLIFSIILGSAIICYLFRDDANFSSSAKALKILAYSWIAQNAFMVVSTLLRNNLYVYNYGLTGKRIGVYYYLCCTLIGLGFMIYKIFKTKTVYFLYHRNSLVFYAILVISGMINWDSFTYQTNYKLFERTHKIDFDYASNFTNTNLPDLITLTKYGKSWDCAEDSVPLTPSCEIYSKLNQSFYSFVDDHQRMEWQSSTRADSKMYKKIQQLDDQHQFEYMDLSGVDTTWLHDNPIKLLSHFSSVKHLILPTNIPTSNLYQLKNLETLRWYGTSLDDLKNIKKTKTLKVLELPNCSDKYIQQIQMMLPDVRVTN